MKKNASFIIILSLIIISGCSKFRKNPQTAGQNSALPPQTVQVETAKFNTKREMAIYLAKKLYQEKKLQKIDFSKSPCLSQAIIPDWVADIAHNPLEAADLLPENQCSSYLQGKTHHIVELDALGNVLRAR